MQVMYEKKLLTRKQEGRAFRYAATAAQEKTLGKMLGDLLSRAFDGSSSALVQHLLQHSAPDDDELAAIREAIESYERNREVK
jgi:predicted transcriptional regulator